MMPAEAHVPFWRMNGISKHYGGVRALENVGLIAVESTRCLAKTAPANRRLSRS
jgi:ABC-type sugar transport system ATPase subunit